MKTPKIILASMSFLLILAGIIFAVPSAVSAMATFDSPVSTEAQTNCDPFETPTKIPRGQANHGKWYCKPKATTQPVNIGSTGDTCGSGSDATQISINIGCYGQGNPIADAAFAIIRVLTDGVGLIVVGSIVVGGIQYSASRGDPQATALAIGRIRSSLIALLIFIFSFAILNFIIPAGFLNQ